MGIRCTNRRPPHTLANSHGHSNYYADPVANADADAYCHVHSDAYIHANANPYASAIVHKHSHAITYAHAYSHINPGACTYADSNSHANTGSHQHFDTHVINYAHAYLYSHVGRTVIASSGVGDTGSHSREYVSPDHRARRRRRLRPAGEAGAVWCYSGEPVPTDGPAGYDMGAAMARETETEDYLNVTMKRTET